MKILLYKWMIVWTAISPCFGSTSLALVPPRHAPSNGSRDEMPPNLILSKVLSVPRGGGDSQSSSLAQAVNAFWKSHPLVAGGTVCAVKATCADLLAQKIQHASASTNGTPQKFDFRQTFAFMLYGALYQGM